MDYTSIHISGHLLSDDILHTVEHDFTFVGNSEKDFHLDASVSQSIDFVWSSLRSAYKYYKERSTLNDPYGTRRSRDLMERLLGDLGYKLQRQTAFVNTASGSYDITYLCPDIDSMPVIVVGDKTGQADIDSLDKCSLDFRAKGERRRKSPHATMLEYLNSTENIYGIVSNGRVMRLIRNSGQLVKLTYLEFDLVRMIEEDKYTEFCLMFRLVHSSRFSHSGDEQPVMERYFNLSVESGNRIREGLSGAVERAMTIIGTAVVSGDGEGNRQLRQAVSEGSLTAETLNKELVHLIYRLLFLFIIEDRNLVYQIPEPESPDYIRLLRQQEIYRRFYSASRFRDLSELPYLRQGSYSDLWQGLMETFSLFETGGTGERLGIKPLGGILFADDTLAWLRRSSLSNRDVLRSFDALNSFTDERGAIVKINYSSLDVEEFGSVYEGILEKRPLIIRNAADKNWSFAYAKGLDRKNTSSYYTRPDLVQSLIRTTLEPVIKERISHLTSPEDKVRALLSMRVCDAASGSGHIVLAMARTIAWYVCSIRTGEDNPASLDYRRALREVIQKCVYAVDSNPDAVELCKLVLWIEGYCAGSPLSFLDHHIRCGNSVVGVADLDVLLQGVPKEAFKAKDDDKEVKKKIIALNKLALDEIRQIKRTKKDGRQTELFSGDFVMSDIGVEHISLAENVRSIASMPENTLLDETTKQRRWEELMASPRVECLRRACDIYTYSFYKEFTADDVAERLIGEEANVYEKSRFAPIPYTRTVYHALEEIKHLDESGGSFIPLEEMFKDEVAEAARTHRFFHWAVEFPDIFAHGGGFDVMCGNPPWDKIKVEDKKWFEQRNRADIVNSGNAAQRKEAIESLKTSDPLLFFDYKTSIAKAEAVSRFVRFSGRFLLTATGDIDLYPLFAEHCLACANKAWGLVIPTGIAINDSNKKFFSKLIEENRLISLYGFENEEKIFQIAHNYKFCLLTVGDKKDTSRVVKGGFYLRRIDHLLDPKRIYTMQTGDFARLNPNTKTCPVFRTSKDAELTKKIYSNSFVIINEASGENPWKIKFGSMIHMSNDSHLFMTFQQLMDLGATLAGNKFFLGDEMYVPLYEGKMIWLYNHHYGTWPTDVDIRPNVIQALTSSDLANPNGCIMPWYWVPLSSVIGRLKKTNASNDIIWKWEHSWMLIYRGIMESHDTRSFVVTTIPNACGVGHSATLLYPECGTMPIALLQGMISSLVFDYSARQKLGGKNMSTYIVKQLPVLAPSQIPPWAKSQIVERVAELSYFNHDLDSWMKELWNDEKMTDEIRTNMIRRLNDCNSLNIDTCKKPELSDMQPFIYNEQRRAIAQAELDAIVAHLYGLNTEDLRYILDPEDVCGKGCINETFRVLKEREQRELGDYRTKRLVMEAWRRFGFDKF